VVLQKKIQKAFVLSKAFEADQKGMIYLLQYGILRNHMVDLFEFHNLILLEHLQGEVLSIG